MSFNLPFDVTPGIADRYVTESSYVNGSLVVVADKEELESLLNQKEYRLKAGVPIYVAAYQKAYKYVEGATNISVLPNFDFLKDDLTPGTIYLWKDNAWYDSTELFSQFATKEQLEEVREELKHKINEVLVELTNKLNKEIQDRENADLVLKAEIDKKISVLNQNIQTLTNELNAETQRAKQEEDKLRASLNQEIGRATQQENILNQNIINLEDTVNDNYKSLTETTSRLSAELTSSVSTLTQGIINTNENLDEETQRAEAVEEELRTKLANEVNRATSRENKIQGDLNTEMQIRATQDSILQSNINKEAQDRAAQDTELQNSIGIVRSLLDQEIQDRITDVDEESSRAQTAEQANAQAIEAEEQRATAKEEQLSEAIQAETTRATNAEAGLQNSVDEVRSELEEEVSNRESADNVIDSRLDAIESKIPSQASSTNKLADKNYVETVVAALSSRFLTPTPEGDTLWESLDTLKAGPWYYQGTLIQQCENNDYATYLVKTSEELPDQQWRAIYQKDTPVGQPGGEWVAAYKYNITFTSAEKEAINSGITKEIVDSILPKSRVVSSLYATDANGNQTMVSQSTFAKAADLNSHVNNKDNPHGVTPAQIGAATTQDVADINTELGELSSQLTEEISRATVAEQTNKSAIEAEVNRAKAEESNLNDAITAEVRRAEQAEQDISSSLDTEIEDRSDGDQALQIQVNDLYDKLETSLQLEDKLNAEITRATNKENALDKAIKDEASRAKTEESNLSAAISSEATRAEEKETELNAAIEAEVTRAKAAEGTVSSLETSSKNLTGAVNEVLGKVTQETQDRESAITSLQNSLEQKITAEESARTGADNTINNSINDINSKIGDGFDSTNTVKKAIDDIKTQAKSDLDTAIAQEIAAREAADESLQGEINTTKESLQEEIDRAKAAEKENTDNITALSGRVSNVETKNTEQDTAISAAQSTADDAASAAATAQSTADSAKATAESAVQSVTGSNGITASKSGTVITVKGTDVTQTASGMMTATDKKKLDAFGEADTYATTTALNAVKTTADSAMPKSGGTFTGGISVSGGGSINTKGYVTGTWLATTNATDLGTKPEKIAVIGTQDTAKNYIYYRTPAEILGDIGAGTYTKPSGGIPKTDLASAVQTSLDKADAAIQTITVSNGVSASKSETTVTIKGIVADTNTIGVAKLHPAVSCTTYSSDDGGATPNAVRKAVIDESVASTFNATTTHRGTMSKEDKAKLDAFGVASTYATKTDVNAKYTKPSGGIPKTDLASAVQTSLGKADTAIQRGGTTGQYLMSQGTNSAPIWAAVHIDDGELT